MPIKTISPESVGMCSSRLSRINEVMQEHVEKGLFSGISTLVARRGQIVHFEQFGYSDREAKTPMQSDTIFRLYSMTKPIICTALMCLYEQGKFDLREPVSKYIPAFAKLKVLEKDATGSEKLVDLEQPVTIHHVLTHTAGLAYDFYEEYSVCDMYRKNRILADTKGVSLEEFVDKICQLPLAFQPGTQWYYSVSHDVVARLIEVISGKSLDKFLNETIFAPLNMQDIGFYLPEEKRYRMAAMYGGLDICAPEVTFTKMLDVWDRGINQRLDVSSTCPIDDPHFLRGGVGLVSTAEDYFKFAQMLLNKGQLNGVRILSPKTVEFMHMNHLPAKFLPIGFASFKLMGYGFGLGSRVLIDLASSQLVGTEGEYGWAGAAKTYYWIDPKEELVGIFMTQSLCNFSMVDKYFQTLVYQAVVK